MSCGPGITNVPHYGCCGSLGPFTCLQGFCDGYGFFEFNNPGQLNGVSYASLRAEHLLSNGEGLNERFVVTDFTSLARTELSRSAGWPGMVLPTSYSKQSETPTTRLYFGNTGSQHRYFLEGAAIAFGVYLLRTRAIFDLMDTFPEDSIYAVAGRAVAQSWFANMTAPNGPFQRSLPFGAFYHQAIPEVGGGNSEFGLGLATNAATGNFTATDILRAYAVKTKPGQQAQTKWVINTERDIATTGGAFLGQVLCENPANTHGTIVGPEWDSVPTDLVMNRRIKTYLFGPALWTDHTTDQFGFPITTGPGTFGYPKPTCRPDIS